MKHYENDLSNFDYSNNLKLAQLTVDVLCETGMTKVGIAKEIGVHPGTINRWMQSRRTPSNETIDKLLQLAEEYCELTPEDEEQLRRISN